MKKAKLMLMAITILGIAGGALAFRAAKFGSAQYLTCNALALPFPTCGVTITAGGVATLIEPPIISTFTTLATTDLSLEGTKCSLHCTTTVYVPVGN